MSEITITIEGPSTDALDHLMAGILSEISRRINADGPESWPCESAESPEPVTDDDP